MISPAAVRPAPVYLLIAAFAVLYVVWGSTYLAIRYVVETMPPFLSAGARFTLAGVLLFTFLQIRTPTRISAAQWRAAALIGTLLLLGGNGLVCWSEQYLPSGLTALLVGTAPMWFATLDWLVFRGSRPTALTVTGLLVGSIGIYTLVGPSGLVSGPQTPLWPALALMVACGSWALGSLYSRRANVPQSAFLATATQMMCGGASQMLAGLLLGEAAEVSFAAITMQSWLAWGYLVIFGSLLAFSCYVWLLRHAPAAQVSTYAYVNPLVAVLLGTLVGGEAFTARIVLAAALIVVAVVVITTASQRTARSAAAAKRAVALPDPPLATETESDTQPEARAATTCRANG